MGRKTNKQRRQVSANTAREKAAAARAEQQRADQRHRALVILSSVVAVAVVLGVIAVVAINHKSKSGPATAASSVVLHQVTTVPASVTETVGGGTALEAGLPQTIQGTSLQSGGKPTLLYIGAEFCPFCAAERWALIESLSRFGKFTGLEQIRSSEDNIATFTFVNSTYTSKYVNFDAKEQADQNRNTLQPVTATENAQWTKYLAPGAAGPGYPFLDFNGQYVSVDPMIDPNVMIGKTWLQISSALSDPSSPISKAVIGASNHITATVCRMTNNQPANVCTAKVQSLSANYQPYQA